MGQGWGGVVRGDDDDDRGSVAPRDTALRDDGSTRDAGSVLRGGRFGLVARGGDGNESVDAECGAPRD